MGLDTGPSSKTSLDETTNTHSFVPTPNPDDASTMNQHEPLRLCSFTLFSSCYAYKCPSPCHDILQPFLPFYLRVKKLFSKGNSCKVKGIFFFVTEVKGINIYKNCEM
ncbi:unnamed protein product [Brassica rapa subsp. trilocularis]